MDALKKNAFLAVMCVVGGLIVICFAYFVLGTWADTESKRQGIKGTLGDIENKKNEFAQEAKTIAAEKKIANMPEDSIITERWAEVFKSERDHYAASIRTILKSCQEMDAGFEQWFPGLTISAGGRPPLGDFVARYADEWPKLEKELKSRQMEIGTAGARDIFGGGGGAEGGFMWESTIKEETLSDTQKKFWIRAKIAAALIAAKAVRLEKVEFPPVKESSSPTTPRLGDLPRILRDQQPLAGSIPVNIVVQMHNENVPDFVRSLLAARMPALGKIPREDVLSTLLGIKEPPADAPTFLLPLRIKELTVAKTTTPPEEIKVPVTEEEQPNWKPGPPDKIPVRVIVYCHIIDFNITDQTIEAVASVEQPPPPAPVE
ncbi:MAG: hypothetical protein RDV41_07500 [Planctomycetota bacterium]|nr:hypothetical protein [Planctomycetota bacterium]